MSLPCLSLSLFPSKGDFPKAKHKATNKKKKHKPNNETKKKNLLASIVDEHCAKETHSEFGKEHTKKNDTNQTDKTGENNNNNNECIRSRANNLRKKIYRERKQEPTRNTWKHCNDSVNLFQTQSSLFS